MDFSFGDSVFSCCYRPVVGRRAKPTPTDPRNPPKFFGHISILKLRLQKQHEDMVIWFLINSQIFRERDLCAIYWPFARFHPPILAFFLGAQREMQFQHHITLRAILLNLIWPWNGVHSMQDQNYGGKLCIRCNLLHWKFFLLFVALC